MCTYSACVHVPADLSKFLLCVLQGPRRAMLQSLISLPKGGDEGAQGVAVDKENLQMLWKAFNTDSTLWACRLVIQGALLSGGCLCYYQTYHSSLAKVCPANSSPV